MLTPKEFDKKHFVFYFRFTEFLMEPTINNIKTIQMVTKIGDIEFILT